MSPLPRLPVVLMTFFALSGLFIASGSMLVCAEEPLHARIDRLIEAAAGATVAPRADDAEFLRRVTLDLAGRVPSVEEARAFLGEAADEKRAVLIDRLLASPEFPRRMRELIHVQLMERAGDHDEWTRFLEESFAANKPWDQLVREILNPNADDEATRGAAFFLTKRLENYGQQPVDLPGLTRDVGRLFLGVDLQCAQCHDHLFIDDYKQVDFQGLHTFVSHATIRKDVTFPAVGEKLVEKKTEFMSVFVKEAKATGPRLPFGAEVDVPAFAKGDEFALAPDRKKNFAGKPKFSPLAILAEQLPAASHAQFARNGVARTARHRIRLATLRSQVAPQGTRADQDVSARQSVPERLGTRAASGSLRRGHREATLHRATSVERPASHGRTAEIPADA